MEEYMEYFSMVILVLALLWLLKDKHNNKKLLMVPVNYHIIIKGRAATPPFPIFDMVLSLILYINYNCIEMKLKLY